MRVRVVVPHSLCAWQKGLDGKAREHLPLLRLLGAIASDYAAWHVTAAAAAAAAAGTLIIIIIIIIRHVLITDVCIF